MSSHAGSRPYAGLHQLDRRGFLRTAAGATAAMAVASVLPKPAFAAPRKTSGIKGNHDLVVAKGNDPAKSTRQAILALGGMNKFVKPGAVVVIKPNMAWDRSPEQAGNTNPAVVAELVKLCLAAGAKRVNVFDRSCNTAKSCYNRSGIQAAAEEKGAKVYFVDEWNTVNADFGREALMAGWPVFRDAVECDTFINVPIAKHHGLTRLTLSMKNLMGICMGDRGQIHGDIGKKLVDVTEFIRPDLTIIDAYRTLEDHGPSGGDLKDVALRKTIIAGTDATLADAFAADLMGVAPGEIPYIAEAVGRGFGSADLKKAKIRSLNV